MKGVGEEAALTGPHVRLNAGTGFIDVCAVSTSPHVPLVDGEDNSRSPRSQREAALRALPFAKMLPPSSKNYVTYEKSAAASNAIP
jgi:hypothetical protein